MYDIMLYTRNTRYIFRTPCHGGTSPRRALRHSRVEHVNDEEEQFHFVDELFDVEGDTPGEEPFTVMSHHVTVKD